MTYPAICDAIRLKHVVRLVYHGGARDVEPYVYGRTQEGEELLRAYQIRGPSRSETPAGWKMFRVDDMTALSVTFEAFTPRADYDSPEKVIAFVNCQV